MRITIHPSPPDKLYEYPGYDPMDMSKIRMPLPTDPLIYELKELGRRSRLICLVLCWMRLDYYLMSVVRNNEVKDQIKVLREVEFMLPKWVNKLIK